MTAMRITLGQLYPDLMSTYGDRGNVDTILRRCGWRGIAADVIQPRPADRIRPGELDLIVIGSGDEAQQALMAPTWPISRGRAFARRWSKGPPRWQWEVPFHSRAEVA